MAIVARDPAKRQPASCAEINPPPRTRTPASARPAEGTPAADDEDKVGYKSPPRHSRFQPGRSGNPRGRPKGAKGLKTIAKKLLTEKVTVKTASGKKTMSRMEAALHKIMEKAFSGDLKALQSIVSLYQSSVPDEPESAAGSGATPAELDAHDEAALATLRCLLLADVKGEA